MPVRVFISHSSKDKPAVERLAVALRERGIQPWLDKWEIGPGDDIVAKINAGLEEATAGLIVFSGHSRESRWVEAETSYLTYARIQEGKLLIPVRAGDDAWIPPLLRPLAYRGIDEVEAIADALLTRVPSRPPPRAAGDGAVERVVVTLQRQGPDGIQVGVRIGGETHASQPFDALPARVTAGRDAFLRGFRAGLRRDPEAAGRAALESSLAELGRALCALCLPGDAAEALANLVDGCQVGTTVEVRFEADDPELLGLPFEALRLKDDRLLATLPPVVVLRRPLGLPAQPYATLAGPLKVLVAVAAPDWELTTEVALDQERELHNILDATDLAQRSENVQVRFLEVAHPDVIAAAVERDAYHVLHISCHGMPGRLELEDEDGRAVLITAGDLLEPMRRTGQSLPLAFLNACHGGVEAGQTASFAEELLRAGLPCVLAMQTSVSDHYATQLARAFYAHLSSREILLPSRALAQARKDLERARLQAVGRGASLAETQPEYATATLFVAGDEEPRLADFALDKQPLRARPVHHVAGPVPQLSIDDLIGRRRELRDTLRLLLDERAAPAGVVLTGIGGVGKSALAGRAMQRLAEAGFVVAAHVGRWDLGGVAVALGAALLRAGRAGLGQVAEQLARADLDDRLRLELLAGVLAQEPVVLVLDDFERNLTVGGAAFHDPAVAATLRYLLENARCGRLLLTSRHPLPGLEAHLGEISVGPLSRAESRKLLRRLEGLRAQDPARLDLVLRVVGGHPRMLEFLDGLLRGGRGRLPHLDEKLRETMRAAGLAPDAALDDLDAALREALLLGARDVLLDELLGIARADGLEEALFQVSVSSLPVGPAGLAHMLADGPAAEEAAASLEPALRRLEELSLVYRFPDGSAWVHRWTAEGLAAHSSGEAQRGCANRAGRYRWWRFQHESHDLGDAWEAVRNHLAGCDFDAATRIVGVCFEILRYARQSVGIAALAGEVLESLPPEHPGYGAIADEEGGAYLALGFTSLAFERYRALLGLYQERVAAEPDRADYQRDLSVSYNKMGDLYRALGQGEQARQAYLQSLAIAERLAEGEPDREDYQVDLAVSLAKVAQAGAGNREESLTRALAILNALKAEGRLAPVDKPKIAAIEDLLRGGA